MLTLAHRKARRINQALLVGLAGEADAPVADSEAVLAAGAGQALDVALGRVGEQTFDGGQDAPADRLGRRAE